MFVMSVLAIPILFIFLLFQSWPYHYDVFFVISILTIPVLCFFLFQYCPFFFWSLCCHSFFGVRPLITPVLSSNSSCISFFGVWPLISLLYFQTLRVCPSSMYGPSLPHWNRRILLYNNTIQLFSTVCLSVYITEFIFQIQCHPLYIELIFILFLSYWSSHDPNKLMCPAFCFNFYLGCFRMGYATEVNLTNFVKL